MAALYFLMTESFYRMTLLNDRIIFRNDRIVLIWPHRFYMTASFINDRFVFIWPLRFYMTASFLCDRFVSMWPRLKEWYRLTQRVEWRSYERYNRKLSHLIIIFFEIDGLYLNSDDLNELLNDRTAFPNARIVILYHLDLLLNERIVFLNDEDCMSGITVNYNI